MVEISKQNENKSIVAVSHSTFIKMLLCMIQNDPLSKALTIDQTNGCINVLDISLLNDNKKKVNLSKLFGTTIKDENFALTLPNINVIRLNEHRHLHGLL